MTVTRCPRCAGAGSVHSRRGLMVCPRCDGTTWVVLDEQRDADHAGRPLLAIGARFVLGAVVAMAAVLIFIAWRMTRV